MKFKLAAVAVLTLLAVGLAPIPAGASPTENDKMCSYYAVSGNAPYSPFRVDWVEWTGQTTVGRVEIGRSSWNSPGDRTWKVEYYKYGNYVTEKVFTHSFHDVTVGLTSDFDTLGAMRVGPNHNVWLRFYIRTSSGAWSRVQVMVCKAPSF